MKKGDHLFLVDGSGYIFRAYHALPPLTRKSDGLPVGAVSGFCNMLWKLMQDARNTDVGIVPTHFAVIFDYSSKTFRNDLYPEYKANRSAPPEDLIPQFGLIRQATRAFNLPCLEMEGFEADDLIATYCRLACEAGGDTTIISSDKDLMQLVGPTVSMYDPMKDRQIGIPEVIEKWGVPPEKMIDLQALTGDSVDNVPGVPGIGPKTAAQLLEQFGDLDGLLERAGEIKQEKRRESIIANVDKARISRQLVTLKNDVPVAQGLDEFVLHAPDGPKLIGFLKTMEFSSLTRRVAETTGTEASDVQAIAVTVERADSAHGPDVGAGAPVAPSAEAKQDGETALAAAGGTKEGNTPSLLSALRLEAATARKIDISAYQCIRDVASLKAWVAEALETGIVAFDARATSPDPMQAELIGLSLATAPGRAAYVPFAHRSGNGDLLGGGPIDNQIPLREALAVLKPLLEDKSVLKIAQNLKYDLVIMSRYGIDVGPFDDTMLISYVLDAGTSHGHGMDALAEKWLGHSPLRLKDVTGSGKNSVGFDQVDVDKATAHAAEDADVTLRLWLVLKPRLAAKGLVSVYERLERPLVPVLARMEQRGISVDRQILSRLSGELAQGAARLEEEIYQLVGERINIGSPKQLGDILFGRMGLPGGSKTKTGQWSTSAQLLEDLAAEGHELPRKIVDWRQLTKLKSTYTDALPGFVNPDTKRVHTSTRSPRRRRGGCHPPTRTCRTSRCAPPRGAGSERPSSPTRATAWFRPTTARSNCACSPMSPRSRNCGRPSPTAPTSTPSRPRKCSTCPWRACLRKCAAAPRRSISASSTASRLSALPTSCRSRARRPATTSKNISSASPASATISKRPRPMPASTVSSKPSSAAASTTPRSGLPIPRSAPSTSAPRSTRACKAPPPTSSAAPWCAWTRRWRRPGFRPACSCRCMTS